MVNCFVEDFAEMVLQAVGSYSGSSRDGLTKLGKDNRAEDSFVALDFTCRRSVETGGPNEHDAKWDEGKGELGPIISMSIHEKKRGQRLTYGK